MAKNINVGDTVYLLDDGGCTEHVVEEKEREGNKFYYGLSGCVRWYPEERLSLTKKEAQGV